MLAYIRTWLIINRKRFLNSTSANSKSYTKFAIVCAPRCGSTWLHTLLNSHPQIISYGEILREKHEAHKTMAALDEMVFYPHHTSIRAVGLKLFYEYQDQFVFQKLFREAVDDNLIHVIHLTREDKGAQFKSLKRAIATQQWSADKWTIQDVPIPIDQIELKDYEGNLLLKEVQVSQLFQHHPLITIKYEDLLTKREVVLASLQKFLNVSPKHLFSILKKQSI